MTKQGQEPEQLPKDLSCCQFVDNSFGTQTAAIAKGPAAFLLPYSSDLGRDGVVSVVRAEQPTYRGMIPRRARNF